MNTKNARAYIQDGFGEEKNNCYRRFFKNAKTKDWMEYFEVRALRAFEPGVHELFMAYGHSHWIYKLNFESLPEAQKKRCVKEYELTDDDFEDAPEPPSPMKPDGKALKQKQQKGKK